MARPFVLLIELARRNQRRQLEVARADDGVAQVAIEELDRFGCARAVDRHGRRAGARHPAAARGEHVPYALALGVQAVALQRRQPRERLRMDVGRQLRLSGHHDDRRDDDDDQTEQSAPHDAQHSGGTRYGSRARREAHASRSTPRRRGQEGGSHGTVGAARLPGELRAGSRSTSSYQPAAAGLRSSCVRASSYSCSSPVRGSRCWRVISTQLVNERRPDVSRLAVPVTQGPFGCACGLRPSPRFSLRIQLATPLGACASAPRA